MLNGKWRIICHFSCGAASAVASKLALVKYGRERVTIIRAFVAEEHEDNDRFCADIQAWLGHPITILRDEKYGASVMEVWRRERYIKGPNGASCARAVKRKLLADFSQPGDTHVLGFTAEEQVRAFEFKERNPETLTEFPLVCANLSKADCLAMIERAGIKLPAMYLLGFNNNNCIGCCKGGKGYWNKIREVFPDRFYQIAAIEDSIGPGAYMLRDDNGERMRLLDLPKGMGRHIEPEISCSFFCDMAEQDIAAATTEQETR